LSSQTGKLISCSPPEGYHENRDGRKLLGVPDDFTCQNGETVTDENRWDEKAVLQAGCGVRSQVIEVLEAQEIKETGNEEG
jgi:hypothetical protein